VESMDDLKRNILVPKVTCGYVLFSPILLQISFVVCLEKEYNRRDECPVAQKIIITRKKRAP